MLFIKKSTYKDFSDGPVVKTLFSNAGGAGSILGQGTKIPHACGQKMKPQNRRNIAKSSIKTLKLVHIGKKKKEIIPNDECVCSKRYFFYVTMSQRFWKSSVKGSNDSDLDLVVIVEVKGSRCIWDKVGR